MNFSNEEKIAIFDKIEQHYFIRNFGSMTKTDFETLLFSEYIEHRTVTVSADKNPDYSTNPGNATQDQVFLLSITEVNKYFSSNSARQCKPTDYAVANGAWENDSGNCWWWLRSPGYYLDLAAYVNIDGDVDEVGTYVNIDLIAVRPALWIDLGSLLF